MSCVRVVVNVCSVKVVGVTYACWGLEEEEIGGTVPGMRVEGQVVALAVVDTVLEIVRTDLLDKTWIGRSGTDEGGAAWSSVEP